MLPSVPVDIHRMPAEGKHTSKVAYPIRGLYIISFKFHDAMFLLMVCKLYVGKVVRNPLVTAELLL